MSALPAAYSVHGQTDRYIHLKIPRVSSPRICYVSGWLWRITRRVARLSRNKTYLSARRVPCDQRQSVWTRTVKTSNAVTPGHAVVCICDSLSVVEITPTVNGADGGNQAIAF